MPQRIQLSRAKGWRMPPNTVKVDRTTRWGNPYMIGRPVDLAMVKRWGWRFSPAGLEFVTSCAEIAVRKFAHCLFWDEAIHQHVRDKLGGKNLACWCAPSEPCHADVLLELANSDPKEIHARMKAIDERIMADAEAIARSTPAQTDLNADEVER